MLVKDIIAAIEAFAPPVYQESYDNCGLQVGDPLSALTGVLLTLDVTEAIVAEAIARNCNLIVAHHPLIFSGIKSISGKNYVERVIQTAIKNDMNIYAAHTNLDNVLHGVNAKFAEKLGLVNTRILVPMTGTLHKLYTYVPVADADKVRDAMFAAGAGHIGNYTECSFSTSGSGTFKPGSSANPAIGMAGGAREAVEEVKIEVLVDRASAKSVISAMKESHPYEEVAYELVPVCNANQDLGAGMIGELETPMNEVDFLLFVKKRMKVDCVRHTAVLGRQVKKVALCGGSGSFLLKDAIRAGADVFITGDFKYHQFFDAEGKTIIADIGHFESEQFTPEIFEMVLKKKFPNFAVLLSNISTNPIKYLF